MLGCVDSRSPSPVFVGRADESRTLRRALDRAAEGTPQAVLLAGESGVGKTRLVEEFAAAARALGVVPAFGGCVEIGADAIPYAPFTAALRALRRALPEETASAAAGGEEDLARLLPEIAVGSAPAHPHRPDAEGAARLFDRTARLLERVAEDRQVLLVLEDLHWSDASTRNLLAYLLRGLRAGRLLVVATHRSEDVRRGHPLRPLLVEIDRRRTARRIDLAPLDRADVGRQLTAILGREPEPRQVREKRERAAELLGLVHAVAAHLGARPLADAATGLARRAGLPPRPTESAPSRKGDLTPREREVLGLVAEGHTNRRIADTLFISPKTAGNHVSNILTKLGVANRGEAAAMAHRKGLFPTRAEDGRTR
ncbi:AAA family ATPase [Streptomyces sp. ZYX-F-203]